MQGSFFLEKALTYASKCAAAFAAGTLKAAKAALEMK
jgi:hypothetical protein